MQIDTRGNAATCGWPVGPESVRASRQSDGCGSCLSECDVMCVGSRTRSARRCRAGACGLCERCGNVRRQESCQVMLGVYLYAGASCVYGCQCADRGPQVLCAIVAKSVAVFADVLQYVHGVSSVLVYDTVSATNSCGGHVGICLFVLLQKRVRVCVNRQKERVQRGGRVLATLTISLVLCLPAVQSLADARQRRPPLDYHLEISSECAGTHFHLAHRVRLLAVQGEVWHSATTNSDRECGRRGCTRGVDIHHNGRPCP